MANRWITVPTVREPLKDIGNSAETGKAATKDGASSRGPPPVSVGTAFRLPSFGTRPPPPGPTSLLDGIQWELRRRRLGRTLAAGSGEELAAAAAEAADLDETVSTVRMSLAGRFTAAAAAAASDGNCQNQSGPAEGWSWLLGGSTSGGGASALLEGASSPMPSPISCETVPGHQHSSDAFLEQSGEDQVSLMPSMPSSIASEPLLGGEPATPPPLQLLADMSVVDCQESSPRQVCSAPRLRRASHVAPAGIFNKSARGPCIESWDLEFLGNLIARHHAHAMEEEHAMRELRKDVDGFMDTLVALRDDLLVARQASQGGA